jgi:hypothetical protein
MNFGGAFQLGFQVTELMPPRGEITCFRVLRFPLSSCTFALPTTRRAPRYQIRDWAG